MSNKSLLMIIILIILIPIALITSNIKAFIIIGSLFIILYYLGSAASMIKYFNSDIQKEKKYIKDYEDETKEMSKLIGMDLNKFGDNIIISRNIMLIIYFIISIFFISSKLVQSVGIVIIAYYIYEGISIIDNNINNKNNKPIFSKSKIHKASYIIHNFLIILFASFMLITNFSGNFSN